MQRTPLGEKISVYTARPGLIVGKKGANIKYLTELLKTKFNMDNPQLEVVEIDNPNLDAATVARNLISGLQRFGTKRFKALAYRVLDETMKAGARGIEVVISGRGVPGERAKSWRFTAGYLKKSGDISEEYVDRCYESCDLRSGTVGVKVSILHPDVLLPDEIKYKKQETKVETPVVIQQEMQVQVKTEENKIEEVKGEVKEKPRAKRNRKKDKVETSEATNGDNKEE
jgi:small subunit ribosomal protein S3